ncbi:MAG TPA: type II TA system antitoxin MqsA family protein [Thermodesulfobacteriota bacterium]|nr:type II TA system antitoxin MqsA family protein [Thermodesulfobacteriota bacterium]
MKCEKCHQACHKTVGNYKYTESGLENVLLKNIPIYKCGCGHTIIEIPAFMQLHAVIARVIVRKPTTLSGEEIRFLRKAIHKSSKELASLLGVTPVTVTRWEKGYNRINPAYEKILKTVVYTSFDGKVKNTIAVLEEIRKAEQKQTSKNVSSPLSFIARKAQLSYRYAQAG